MVEVEKEMEEERQAKLHYDLGEGKMGLERAGALTQVLFSPLMFDAEVEVQP